MATILGDGLKDLVDITIDGETITSTAGHPFWVTDDGHSLFGDHAGEWVDAGDLRPGDRLLEPDGDTLTIDLVRTRTTLTRVHNLTISGVHTYYVLAGAQAVLVHNTGPGCPVGGAAEITRGGMGSLSKADDYGVWPYRTLRTDIKGTGLQAHHLIEQRFAGVMGQGAGDMASIALTDVEHQVFTNAWRRTIPYGPEGTGMATRMDVESAARRIYAGYPALLKALGL